MSVVAWLGRPAGSHQNLAVAMVFCSVVSVQCGSAIASGLFDQLGPEGTMFLRSLLAGVVFLAVVRPSPRMLREPGFHEVLIFGVVLFGMNSFFYAAIDRIPLGAAVTLEFVGPLGLAVIGSHRRRDLIWVALAAAGILLLSDGLGDGLLSLGAVFAIGSGLFWALYIVQSARLGQRFAGVEPVAVAIVLSAVLGAPLGIVEGGSDLLHPAVLAVALAVGLLSTMIPYTLELQALKRIPNAVFGVMMSLQPAVAALVGLALLSQGLSAKEVLAIGLVVVASAGALRTGSAPPPIEN
jgi:inner membrane transporter RhtA